MEHPDPFRLENKVERPEEKQEGFMKKPESLPVDLKEAVIESVIKAAKWPSWAAVNIIAEWVPILNTEGMTTRSSLKAKTFQEKNREFGKMLQRYSEYVAIAEIVLDNRKLWATIQGIGGKVKVYESLRSLFDPLNLTDTFRLHLGQNPKYKELINEIPKIKRSSAYKLLMPNKYSRNPSSPHFREGRRFPLEGPGDKQ